MEFTRQAIIGDRRSLRAIRLMNTQFFFHIHIFVARDPPPKRG